MAKTGCALLLAKVRELGSQAEAARRSDVSQANISRILNEGVQPTLDTAFSFEDNLGIPVTAWRRSRARRASGGLKRKGDASPASDGERRVA